MIWLFAHDVWPRWTAKNPPVLKATDWLRTEGRQSQYDLEDEFGRFGSVWTEYQLDQAAMSRSDLIWIFRAPPLLAGFAPVRIHVDSTYTGAGVLDEITMRVETPQADVELHGERFHSGYSFKLDSGPIERTLKVPITSGGAITSAFNPLGALTNLHVGDRWNMQIVNPIATVTGIGDPFIPLLIEVTGEERLKLPDGERNCTIVEAKGVKAWIDPNGAVQKQELLLPVIGKLTIVRRAEFDEHQRSQARSASMSRRSAQP
jgi:hypothetical protein